MRIQAFCKGVLYTYAIQTWVTKLNIIFNSSALVYTYTNVGLLCNYCNLCMYGIYTMYSGIYTICACGISNLHEHVDQPWCWGNNWQQHSCSIRVQEHIHELLGLNWSIPTTINRTFAFCVHKLEMYWAMTMVCSEECEYGMISTSMRQTLCSEEDTDD